MSVLFFNTMRYKVTEPKDAANDRFVLSKGHAAPVLYAAWAEAGLIPKDQLTNLRKLDSDLEGHPTPVCCLQALTLCQNKLYILWLLMPIYSKYGK